MEIQMVCRLIYCTSRKNIVFRDTNFLPMVLPHARGDSGLL